MSEVNWRRVFIVSSLVFAFLLVCGSIYLHLQQKNHLGRLRHEGKVVPINGVDAATDLAIALSIANETYDAGEEMYHWMNMTIDDEYYIDESDYSNDFASSENLQRSDVLEPDCKSLREMLFLEDFSHNMLERKESTHSKDTHATGLTEACLQCICETTTMCRQSMCSDNKPCGLFRISHLYWMDAGSPTLEGRQSINSDTTDSGYHDCVNNVFCSARTVYSFVDKYARDCNNDGIIDCRDHIALHINGPTGCVLKELSSPFYERMERCLDNSVNKDMH